MERHTATGRGRALTLAALAPAALAAAAAAAGALNACRPADGAEVPASITRYGESVAVGRGTARAYVTTTNGVPAEVGVVLSEAALDGLPDEHTPGGVSEHGHGRFDHVLELPAGNPTPFRHVVVNWNPGGHEPPGIYDTPHFDFHFYVIGNADRLAIDPADPDYHRKAGRKPAPQLIPERYVMPEPLAFARMGVHWVDTTSAELTGGPFTATFIYGSWDGRMIFAEPMVAKAFLETKPSFQAEVPAPPRGRDGGLYPQGYAVRWEAAAREYRVTLTGLIAR